MTIKYKKAMEVLTDSRLVTFSVAFYFQKGSVV